MKRMALALTMPLALAGAVIPISAFQLAPAAKISVGSGSATSNLIAFGPTTVVDDQRVAGEPGIKVCGPSASWSLGNCGADNPYATAPWGFSTTSSFIWRSEDHGSTYKPVPSNTATGKPDACPGGGDSDIAVSPGASQRQDYLNFADLQGLTNFSTGVTRDGGQSFTCNVLTTPSAPVDRQWFGVYGNPAGASLVGGNGSKVYLDYDVVAGAVPTCLTGTSSNGNAFIVSRSLDGGSTWDPAYATVDCNDGIAGNIQVNQSTGHVFAIHTAYSSTTQTFTDQVTVNRSTDSGLTWTASPAFTCTGACVVGSDFATLAIDKSGGLYATWSQSPADSAGNVTGPSHIYYVYSSDDGLTWGPEHQVDNGSTNVNVFAWIVAGNAGAIDIVWYGTNKASGVTSYDSGMQTSDWFPYLAQSLNANTGVANFSAPVAISQHSHHNGGICTMGIGCTTGGDRSLTDFFQVDINSAGAAVVTWADTSNNGNSNANQGALIDSATQIAGPTLYGGSMNGSLVICRAVTSTPCQTDPTGDAKFEAGGLIGSNVPKLDITGSSVNLDPTNPSRLRVRLQVANLSTLPNATDGILGGPYVDFLTSWNYHQPGGTQATFDSTGNIYYAYLEVNTATGAVTALDGNTCSLATTHPKYLVYPGQTAIQSQVNNADGTIDLFVPLSDVGNPPVGATLYSVTAHTLSQPLAAGPSACSRLTDGSNPDPTGQIFNVYDKSSAYTAILTTPTTQSGCHEGDGQGSVHGKNGGNAQFQSDEDSCKDGDRDGEQMKDPGANEDFHSTEIRAKQFNDSTGTMTISGVGLANGLPVTFVIVEQAATAVTPAIYTIQLSDGYVNTSPLLSGAITLN